MDQNTFNATNIDEKNLLSDHINSRQSSFELLRLISMFFIVLYHYLLWFVQDNSSHADLKAFWLPLHVGVICFVLISGFFRIKPTSKGLVKFVLMVLVYSLPGMIVEIKNAGNWHDILHSFMFISRTNYWFVRTYFGLYLVSPLINLFLDHASVKQKWYLLVVLGFISIYLGNFSRCLNYEDGKNLVNFLFLYLLGQLLSSFSNQWKKIKLWKLLAVYLLLNVILVTSYYFYSDTIMGQMLWRLSFPYSSPILIVNAILLFVIIGHFSFSSSVFNQLSAGVFAIYLIHGSTPLFTDIQRNIVSSVFACVNNNYALFIGVLMIMVIGVMLFCLLINKLLTPFWMISYSIGNMVYKKLGF